MYGGYLPSQNSRWCTKELKLKPFEKFVGNDPVVSYVGIRGDEDREGYISRKANIQSIFPFRRNLWSEDVIMKLLANSNINDLANLNKFTSEESRDRFDEIIKQPTSQSFIQSHKLNLLLDENIAEFNKLVFSFLRSTDYPLSAEPDFPLLGNQDNLNRDEIFKILEESGVGYPQYYKKIDFEIGLKTGQYARSRSGCFFCFFQQKIEWVWLYEQHPEKFIQAMEYEKDGYTWCQGESLAELIQPERIAGIKQEYLKRMERNSNPKSPLLLDILADAEGEGCAACFI